MGPGVWEGILRLLLAAALGAVIGAERETTGQDAGLRTHIMLSLGAALFGLMSVGAFDEFVSSSDTNVQVDVTRIASYVAPGIGFIGGGAILKQSGSVRGLTTAASLWIAAAAGLASGLGSVVPAVVATAFALASLAALRPVRRMLRRVGEPAANQLVVVMVPGANASDLVRDLGPLTACVHRIVIARNDHGAFEVELDLGVCDHTLLSAGLSALSERPDVSEVRARLA